MKQFGSLFMISLLSGVLTLSAYKLFFENKAEQSFITTAPSYSRSVNLGAEGIDFTSAADKAVHSVVHVKNVSLRTVYDPFAEFFYGNGSSERKQEQIGTGSGVIVSADGYIVTNNHVIQDASELEVTLNDNKSYKAKLIGTDSKMDIALLKIEANEKLPFIIFGDSDSTKVGEWVLAVGNPYQLNSTVTAGIISAKARNLDKASIQSFIQTDAAVNPGNSGGALVNLSGELIGINSAIATASGGYSGYSFAIPSSLVKKVMDDLLEFGEVQRGLLGVQITDVDASIAEHLNLKINQGVLINNVNAGSAAEESKMAIGDVITAINNHPIRSVSELQEQVARYRPGKEILVQFLRRGEELRVTARLKNYDGNEGVAKREILTSFDGLTVEEVDYKDLAALKLEGGIRVKDVQNGKWKKSGIQQGLVIAFIDRVPVDNIEDFNCILEYKRGGILIEGYYPSGEKGVYGIDW